MPIHTSKMTKWCFKGALVLALLSIGTTPGIALDKFSQMFGTAISGYDTVAYHTEGRAVKGKAEFSHEWNDANWYFASAKSRDLFAADPERYAPQFGGYCTGSLSYGMVVQANPTIFKIIDGKLYFANSVKRSRSFQDQKAIKRAHKEWATFNKEN